MIKIVTDSSACLESGELEEYGINQLPLLIQLEGNTYKDTEVNREILNHLLCHSTSQATSSHPPLLDFYEAFLKPVEMGDSVVGIFLSAQLSGTYATAVMAKKMVLEKHPAAVIEVIDSQAAGMGFVVRAAARTAQEEGKIDRVLAITREMIARIRVLFMLDTLENLKKGGRIGGGSALLGAILGIKPVLTVKDGRVEVLAKARTREKALLKLFETIITDCRNGGLAEASVAHVCCPREAEDFARNLSEHSGIEVSVKSLNPVLSMHLGLKAIGVGYYTGEKKTGEFFS